MKAFRRILAFTGFLAIASSILTAVYVADTAGHYGICAFVFMYGIGSLLFYSTIKRDQW